MATMVVGQSSSESTPSSKLLEAIKSGKFGVNSLLRYERADQDAFGGGLDPRESNAVTLRTRLGYTTGSLYHFKGMLEFEDVTILGNENNFNQAGLNPAAADRTVVADPETTEVNQAWIAYENYDTIAKFGRQVIVLDNSRFVGDVIWRQNQQTYDAVSLKNTGLLSDTSLFYSYIFNVNRILGDEHRFGDFESESHVFNGSYSGFEYGKLTAYSYLLDLKNSPANSSATYGGSFVGSAPVAKDLSVDYRAEYAYQEDYGNNPIGYDADYYHLSLGGKYKKVNAGVGFEVLGSEAGRKGFVTPLATLHKFNGWGDAFLSTPADGLEDLYFWVGGTLPGNVPVRAIYHDFSAQESGRDYGHEIDLIATRSFGKHFKALIKYALYEEGRDGRAGRNILWVQGNVMF